MAGREQGLKLLEKSQMSKITNNIILLFLQWQDENHHGDTG